MSTKLRRHLIIKDILNRKNISQQDDVIKLLKIEGVHVTQATLSRDFADLGVVRTFTETGVRYVLSADESGKQLSKLIGLEIINVEHNESTVVLRTLAGRAQGVAHYIDRLNKTEIIGTVGGDDTVIIIPNTHKNIQVIISLIKEMMNKTPQK